MHDEHHIKIQTTSSWLNKHRYNIQYSINASHLAIIHNVLNFSRQLTFSLLYVIYCSDWAIFFPLLFHLSNLFCLLLIYFRWTLILFFHRFFWHLATQALPISKKYDFVFSPLIYVCFSLHHWLWSNSESINR